MVRSNLLCVVFILFFIMEWWAQVTVIPEESKITVLRRGIWKGFIAWIPRGGQMFPISIVGANLLWKNIQKKDTKNKISEIINNNIPARKPLITWVLWYPWRDLSLEISLHHLVIAIIKSKAFNSKRKLLWFIIIKITLASEFIAKIPTIRGHGLGEIIWKKWNCEGIICYKVSERYIDNSIVKTYLWIKATAISKISKIIKTLEKKFNRKIGCLLRAIKMCPAVMLAQSRTDSVIGRIICLTLSIRVMNCESNSGVESGTKWLRKWLVLLRTLKRINPNQKGRARLSVFIICLVIV